MSLSLSALDGERKHQQKCNAESQTDNLSENQNENSNKDQQENLRKSKNSSSWGTKKLVLLALFTALCTLLSFVEVPIFPAAPWLKYDASACIALLAAFAFKKTTPGIIVGECSALIHGLIMGDPWGALMTIIYMFFWIVPAAIVFQFKTSRPWVVLGLVISAVIALAATIGANLLVTPLYAGMTVDAVAALIVPVLIPFNLLKLLINSVLFFALYVPVLKLTQR